jgi:NAD(P)-dependent dehydrogenase (short-subunit alcohol dehydrogenase family)
VVRFADKVVIVTGAGSGIGRAIARQVHAEGAHVVAVDVVPDGVEALADELDSGRLSPLELDIRDRERTDAVVDDVVAKSGGVDVLFNNAGVSDQFTPAGDTSDELWDSVVGVNLIGPFRLARRVLPSMIARGGGAIVNTGSVASIVGGAGGAAYTVSKHGILGLTRSLAIDYGSKGVRVNAVLPGAIRTGLTSSEDAVVEGADDAIAATPAGRWAEPEEVARIAVFLASDDASFIYGSAYTVDGGWSLP